MTTQSKLFTSITTDEFPMLPGDTRIAARSTSYEGHEIKRIEKQLARVATQCEIEQSTVAQAPEVYGGRHRLEQ